MASSPFERREKNRIWELPSHLKAFLLRCFGGGRAPLQKSTNVMGVQEMETMVW